MAKGVNKFKHASTGVFKKSTHDSGKIKNKAFKTTNEAKGGSKGVGLPRLQEIKKQMIEGLERKQKL